MKGYNEFNLKLEKGINSFLTEPLVKWKETAIKNVNGLAGEELRRLISLDIRRKNGAFFTDSLLANEVLQLLKPTSKFKDLYKALTTAAKALALTNKVPSNTLDVLSKAFISVGIVTVKPKK